MKIVQYSAVHENALHKHLKPSQSLWTPHLLFSPKSKRELSKKSAIQTYKDDLSKLLTGR